MTLTATSKSSQSEKPVVARETIPVQMPAAELWPLISNTQLINAAFGMPSVMFQPDEDGVYLWAESQFLGIRLRWQEMPFEWVTGHGYQVERRFKGSPIRSLVVGVRLREEDEAHTVVEAFAEIEPRNYLGRLWARLFVSRWIAQKFRLLCQMWESHYRKRQSVLFPAPSPPRVNDEFLHSLGNRIRAASGVDEGLLAHLLEHLRVAPDEEVSRMRPFALADRWGIPRFDVLRLFLHATRHGLLDLQWEILCPNCRVAKATYRTLAEVEQQAHCESCHITFDATFDQYVELRFTVNPRVRSVESATFCVGGPFMTPHIKAQSRVPAGERTTLSLPLPPGHYTLRCVALPARRELTLTEAASSTRVSLLLDDDGVAGAEPIVLQAGEESTIEVENQGAVEALLIAEQSLWDQQGVSAALVTAWQEFRDLFSSEILAPGVGIEVRTLTFLFSDLKNSTVLYEQAGDSPAYCQVRDHFVALTSAINHHQGALVKTIGDAVMAVFSDASQALLAAIESQQAIAELNATYPSRPPLRLKLGLHSGPCIAISANNAIDYFGSTVNAAARAQGLSVGGDIILTRATAEEPGVRELLAHHSHIEDFEAVLKGLTPTFTLHRLWPLPEIWNTEEMEDGGTGIPASRRFATEAGR